jgi:hypothetical protein
LAALSVLLGGCGCPAQQWQKVSIAQLREEVERRTDPQDNWKYQGTAAGEHYFFRQGHRYAFPFMIDFGVDRQQRRYRTDAALLPLSDTFPFIDDVMKSKVRSIFTRWNATGDGFVFSLDYREELASPPSAQRALPSTSPTDQAPD